MAQTDDDEAAGQELYKKLTAKPDDSSSDMPTVTVTAAKPKDSGGDSSSVTPQDVDEAQGRLLHEQLLKQQQAAANPANAGYNQPPAPPPTAQQLLDAKMGVTGIRNAFSYKPDEAHFGGLLAFLPISHDSQGTHFALPQAVKNIGNGMLDLAEGPTTGNVTQDARGVLMTGALQGRNRMFGEAGTPLAASDFTANPVRAGTLDQSILGKGGYKPSMVGEGAMPIPDTQMMSPATTKFVDLLYHSLGGAVGGAVGAAVDHVVGTPGFATMAGTTAGSFVHKQTADLLNSLLPAQKAAVAANMAARGMGDLARRLGLTVISPGTTPDSSSSKIPYVPASPPNPNPLMRQGMPFA